MLDANLLRIVVEENSIVMLAVPTLSCQYTNVYCKVQTQKCKLETCLIKMYRNEF